MGKAQWVRVLLSMNWDPQHPNQKLDVAVYTPVLHGIEPGGCWSLPGSRSRQNSNP